MSDLVERLRETYESVVTGNDVLRNPDGPEAAARIEQLEAALLPFAEESKRFDDACEHFNHPRMPDEHQPRTHFTHGQLRAARAAIENKNVW